MIERLLKADEVAKRLTISTSALRRLRVLAEKAEPGSRPGPQWVKITERRVAYPEEALEDYLRAVRAGQEWRW